MVEAPVDRAGGALRDDAVRRARRLRRAQLVELAAAVAVRLAGDHVLAGAGPARAVPAPVRRTGTPWGSGLASGHADARTLGAHDARGARAHAAEDGRALRLRAAAGRGEQGYAVSPGGAVTRTPGILYL